MSTNSSIDAPASQEAHRRTGLFGWLTQLRSRLGRQGSQSLRDTLETALRQGAHTDTAFSNEEREMLLRILRFGASRVDDIMVPRADITAMEENQPLRELILTFEEAGVSRIPLFHETLDDPRGMVHIKDLFSWLVAEAMGRSSGEMGGSAPVADPAGGVSEAGVTELDVSHIDLTRSIASARIRRPVLFVPPSMSALNLLIRMQSSRIHMAIVVDEYGGSDGLVTIEDLVEQIVGDIEDEHDEAEAAHITADPKQGWIASARTPVAELEEHLGQKLLSEEEQEDIDTLGGLVFAIVGRVPVRGELVRHASGIEFEILDADPRRVKKLRVHRPKQAPVVPDGGGKAQA